MKILALETSAKAVSVATAEDGALLASRFANEGQTHSVTLMPMLQEMLREAELTVGDMDLIAVTNGPGSFTGLRIGVSAAKGLAWALGLPCCGVSTLWAMAQNARDFEGLVIGAMDARCSQIYNALFLCRDGQLRRLTPDRAIGLAELLPELEEYGGLPKLILGDGAALCYTDLSEQGVSCRTRPGESGLQNARGVAAAAYEMAKNGQTVSAGALAPVYLRLSQAERERLAKGLPITLDQ